MRDISLSDLQNILLMDSTPSNSSGDGLNRFSIVTLIFFMIVLLTFHWDVLIAQSILFVINDVSIPFPLIRISKYPLRYLRLSIPLNLATAPPLIVLLLKVSQCIPWSVVRDGITGGGTGVEPYNIMILFFSLAYLAMSLGTALYASPLTNRFHWDFAERRVLG